MDHPCSSPPATDDTGDYLTATAFPVPSGSSYRPLLDTELHTHFSARRASPYALPLVDLAHGRGTVPPQPQPVSLGPPSMMSSVLGYIGSLSVTSAGDQIDALRKSSLHRCPLESFMIVGSVVAGPDRPIPTPATRPPPAKSAEPSSSAQTSVNAKAAGMSSGVGDLYNRLGTALAERGYVRVNAYRATS